MDEVEYNYWVIEFVSCESNDRWVVVRTPIDWEEYDVESRIPMGGSGDDVAYVKSIYETNDTDFGWDFCD